MADMASARTYEEEVNGGKRFKFGENWAHFLNVIDEYRIEQAVDSLKNMLELETLEGMSFLDIGCGSGLFSLAARRLGAKVLSFDYDPKSVACTAELKRRYFESDRAWQINTGSVLDRDYLNSLGKFDIVYSWGVLHHTGAMWTALDNVAYNVAPSGKLFLALYNDQGRASKFWWLVKRTYVALPKYLQWLVLVPGYVSLWGPITIRDFVFFRPFRTWLTYKNNRGMSPHRDVVDWIGGFPFEVSKPEQIFDFYKNNDFKLTKLKTCAGGHGCNQFVFQRNT